MGSRLKRANQNKREHVMKNVAGFVCQISKLEVGRILRERSGKCIGDKQILFLPKFWSNLSFSIVKSFSRILFYLNFDFEPSGFDIQMKLNGLQN